MNKLYEVKTVYSMRQCLETHWKSLSKEEKLRYLWLSLVATLGFALITIVVADIFSVLIAAAIDLCFWLFYFFFLGHYIAGRKGIAVNRKECNAPFPTYLTTVYDTKVEICCLENERISEFPLDRITAFSETKNYFLLFSSDRRIFDIISKDGFTTGDADSFRDFAKKHFV